MSRRARALRAVTITVIVLVGAAACGTGGGYPDTPLPSSAGTGAATASTAATPSTPVPTPSSAPTPPPTSVPTSVPGACGNATQSYDPLPALPRPSGVTGTVKAIRDRGYLVAGVSADSLLLGSRNPLTGRIEGFDIDLVHEVAAAILGDPSKVQLVVIQSADRIPVLQRGAVDVVVRNMTMTCDRWAQVAFSAEYYRSGLKILVRRGSTAASLDALSGQRVCAPDATSTLEKVRATRGVIAVGAATHTGCLVRFQRGEVDAIAGDDTVLAGLAAQDPYAVVPAMTPLTDEPYGIAVAKDRTDLVRFLNTLLAQLKADGRWKAMYDRWFAARLGAAPAPPAPVYGRQ